MSVVRVRRFAASGNVLAGSYLVLANAPTGRTAVVKFAVLWNVAGATRHAEFWHRTPTMVWSLLARQEVLDRGLLELSRYVVLNPGDDLVGTVTGSTGSFTGYAAGSLLAGAPT